MTREQVIEAAARAAHEANRAFCLLIGDTSQPAWDEAPDWQKNSARQGVEAVMRGEGSPRGMHENWMAQKAADGWVYGAVKDAAAKTHPCMVPYDQLPIEQQCKDDIFLSVTAALVAAGFTLPATIVEVVEG